uniref:G-protein coupled receptors family 1 profile domain-containing protein n=1 Tax=Loxodonta africana TaxID=9785 RepID=G3U375_LOXAF
VYLLIVIISLCGLVGNGIVIWLLGFCIKRNAFSVYILNLASADFAFLLRNIMFVLVHLFDTDMSIYYWLMKECTYFFYLVSLSFLMAISLECCLSVLFPLWYKCHRLAHLSAIVCALIWGLSLSPAILRILCSHFVALTCYAAYLFYHLILFFVFSEVCVSSLILVIQVQGFSKKRQSSRIYVVISLTVILGLPFGVTLVNFAFSPSFSYSYNTSHICYLLSAVNSSVNPVIYFFVGRTRQQQGQKSLREVLQSALIDDAEQCEGHSVTSTGVGSSAVTLT